MTALRFLAVFCSCKSVGISWPKKHLQKIPDCILDQGAGPRVGLYLVRGQFCEWPLTSFCGLSISVHDRQGEAAIASAAVWWVRSMCCSCVCTAVCCEWGPCVAVVCTAVCCEWGPCVAVVCTTVNVQLSFTVCTEDAVNGLCVDWCFTF
jgi:hypothetical protein